MNKTLNKIKAKFYLKLFLKYHFIIPKKNYFFNARNLAEQIFWLTTEKTLLILNFAVDIFGFCNYKWQ